MSTRKVDDLMQALGMSGISKSQVSEWCGALDERVNDFLDRPLTARYNLMRCRTPKVYEVGGFHRLAFAPRYLPRLRGLSLLASVGLALTGLSALGQTRQLPNLGNSFQRAKRAFGQS